MSKVALRALPLDAVCVARVLLAHAIAIGVSLVSWLLRVPEKCELLAAMMEVSAEARQRGREIGELCDGVKLLLLGWQERSVDPALTQQANGLLGASEASARLRQQSRRGSVERRQPQTIFHRATLQN